MSPEIRLTLPGLVYKDNTRTKIADSAQVIGLGKTFGLIEDAIRSMS